MYKIKYLKNEEESAIIHILLCAYLVMVAENNIEKVSSLHPLWQGNYECEATMCIVNVYGIKPCYVFQSVN